MLFLSSKALKVLYMYRGVLELLLGLEAPVMMPNGVNFLFYRGVQQATCLSRARGIECKGWPVTNQLCEPSN